MNISPALTKAAGRALLQIQKHSPAILTTVGVAAVVTSGVLAAKNTLKLEERVDEGQDRIRWTKEQIAEDAVPEAALSLAYSKNVIEVAKLYVVPVTLMAGGLICILSAQNILRKRNVALAAAYKGLETAFSAYRERVREEVGEEKERDIYYGLKDEEVKDEVTGKVKTVKRPVDGEHVASPYRFVYDSSNENWTGWHDQNLFRVTQAQNMYNDLLKARGHVFLNEVLDTLGFKRTPAGSVTGWIYKPNDPEHTGDNFIEFNIRDLQDDARYGYIVLDFNVDGTIFDQI